MNEWALVRLPIQLNNVYWLVTGQGCLTVSELLLQVLIAF